MLILPVEKKIDWKRPPVALLVIIIVNILAFFMYQGLDEARINSAIQAYQKHKLLNIELPLYKQYLSDDDSVDISKDNLYIEHLILADPEFHQYIIDNSRSLIPEEDRSNWLKKREYVDTLWSKVSYQAYGLQPANIKLITLFTHQFLHGDFFHLLGNLVFLLMFGFAAEAALGSIRFFSYYLVSGFGAGLFFAAFENLFAGLGLISLVGASGAISGVLAMYLVLFRFQKIKFFYWILFFTGYFRAIALIVLPIYIGIEIYLYTSNTGSNVAYTAHIGGFISGAILISLTQSFNKKSINDNYLQGNEEASNEYSVKLDALYKQIGQCNFKQAWSLLRTLIKEHGQNSELIVIEYNLIRALNFDKLPEFFLKYFGKAKNNITILSAQLEYWNSLSNEQQQEIPFSKQYLFAIDLLTINQVDSSERIFNQAKHLEHEHAEELAVLARNISIYYQNRNHQEDAEKYNILVQKLITSSS